MLIFTADFVMQNMAGVPKTTDGKKLFLLLEGELDKTVEIVLTPSSMKASWVMNLKCPFMRDFVDPDFRQTAREGMLQYALCTSSKVISTSSSIKPLPNVADAC